MWESGGDEPDDEFDTRVDYVSSNEVIDGKLWIGSAEAARVSSEDSLLVAKNIKCILSIGESPHCYAYQDYRHLRYKRLVADDDVSEVRLAERFHEAADWIHANLDQRVLVHCQAGQSRSAAIVLAYLMKYQDMSYEQAFERLRSVRPQVEPNVGFVRQLKVFEQRVRAK